MQAADGMFVTSQIQAQVPRHHFLKHGKAKNVVWQPLVSIVSPHVRQHMELAVPAQELQRACTGHILVLFHDIISIKELDDGLPGILLFLEKVRDFLELIQASPVEESGPIAAENTIAL